ncbi:MAG: lysophospholipid acyltransferase family protein [bacterium]|nr:lysophospholipid acyltransferase family protein [bacterium]
MAGTIHRYAQWTFPAVNAFFLKEAAGLEQVPRKGPFILASNHISIPDEWIMANIIYRHSKEPVRYLARDDYWWGPWWTRRLERAFGTLLIDWRNPSSVLEQAGSVLEQGGVVGIYPEGTRNTDSMALALGKTGAARLALATGAPVIPVGYFGPPIARIRDVFREFVIKRNTVSFAFGPGVNLSAYIGKPITRDLLYAATDDIMAAIGALCGKKPRLHDYES